MYPEAALGLFISRGRIEIECLGVLRCCELDLVAALVDAYAVKFSRARLHDALLCKRLNLTAYASTRAATRSSSQQRSTPRHSISIRPRLMNSSRACPRLC